MKKVKKYVLYHIPQPGTFIYWVMGDTFNENIEKATKLTFEEAKRVQAQFGEIDLQMKGV